FTVLAGFGFDALAQRRRRNAFRLLAIAAGFPLLISLGVATGVVPGSTPEQLQSAISGYGVQALLLALAIAAIVFLLHRGALKALPAGMIILVLAFVDLYLAGADFNRGQRNPEELFTLNPALKQMMTPASPDSLFRIKMREGGYMAMARNQGMV